jgi:competence protein ComEC
MRPSFVLPPLILSWLTGCLLYFISYDQSADWPLKEIWAVLIGIWWLKPTVGSSGFWQKIAPLLLLMAMGCWGAVRMHRALDNALPPPEKPQSASGWVLLEGVESQGTWGKNYRAELMKSPDQPKGGEILLALPKKVSTQFLTAGTVIYVRAWAQAVDQSFWKLKGLNTRWRVQSYCWSDQPKAGNYPWLPQDIPQVGAQIGPHWNPELRALYRALVWGQKQGVSPEMRQRFSQAGVSHLLAVSGLHMGLAYQWMWWLSFALWGVPKKTRVALAICGLWTYAWICGAGPSVLRAAGMISLWIVSRHSQRPGVSRQIFWIALWGSLLWNPLFLFQVGFQMSYAAVTALIWGFPPWKNYWKQKLALWSKQFSGWGNLGHGLGRLMVASEPLIQLIGISLIAQLGVLPISLYYFKTFPLHFLVANLMLVPFMGLVVGLGLLIGLLPSDTWWSIPYAYLLEGMWRVVDYLGAQDQWVLTLDKP